VLLKKKKRTKEREIYTACTYGTGRCLGGTTLLMLFILLSLDSSVISIAFSGREGTIQYRMVCCYIQVWTRLKSQLFARR
jgi:hypothetical protein